MSLFKRNDDTLDQAIAEVTGEPVDPAVVEQAAARVWERLSQGAPVHRLESRPAPVAEVQGSLKGCDDFQALIPAYLRGELPAARALLVEDHTRTCVPCRRALREAREGKAKEARPAAAASMLAGRSRLMWQSLAAAVVIGLGIGLFLLIGEMMAGGSKMARVESVDGLLFEIDGQTIREVNAGDVLDEGQEIRTAKGSTALVRMTDGSGIELSERATLSLEASRKGNTIHLDGGRVIVEAAKQRDRHLFVSTSDSLVSVTGTIFSVNNGTKGTRVSVVEGEVRVKQARRDDILHPGDQVTTHASVSAVPIRREIAWSRNAQQYEQLLAELTALGKEIDAQVERPGLRYSTKLLDLAPEGTMAFIALPNLAHSLSETHRILDEKLEGNPTVRQWWNETLGTSEKQQKFREMIQKIGDLGRHLGDEIAIAVPAEAEGKDDDVPVILAEVTDEALFRAILEQEIEELKGKNGGKDDIILVDDPAGLSGIQRDGMYLWVGNGLFVASPDGAQIARIAAGGISSFPGTPFRARIAQEYQDGAGWLFAADLAGFMAEETPDPEAEALGVRDLQHFIVNRQEVEGRADTRAALTFSQQRRGMASWLAAPAPMGALSFISPDANLASAFIVRQPASVLDDMLAISPEMAQELEKIKQEHGFDIREDLAAPLGGEFVFAVDGPLLPTPSWKLVAEVYDPARLQLTLEKMVEHVNAELREEGETGQMTIRQEEVGDRTFYTIQCQKPKVGFDYTFEDGYVVAAPTRALLERSLQQRESGVSLASHPKFRDLLGQDGQVNVSAFFYQNLQPVLESAGKLVPEEMKKNQNQIQNLILGQGPTLIYAYAEEDRILFASSSTSPLGLNLQTLAGMGGVLGMMDEAHGEAERMQAETSADETR